MEDMFNCAGTHSDVCSMINTEGSCAEGEIYMQ